MKGWWTMAAVTVLAGCSTPDTAMQLVREQQEIQRAAQDHEARQRADAVAPESAVYLSSIRRLQTEGRHFAALAHLDAYQNRFGDSAETALLRADALRATGQREASEAAYQALLTGPHAFAAWHGLGLLAAAQSDHPRALQALARAAALAPTNVDVLGDLGYARLRAGDRAGARIPLAQAAELAPDSHKAVANLALLMVAEGNDEGAEAVMARAGLADAARAAVRRQGAQLAALPAAVDATRPIVRAIPGPTTPLAADAPARGGTAAAVGTLRQEAAAPSPATTIASRPPPTAAMDSGATAASALDLYAAPLPSLLDRFAASGSTLQ